MIRPHLSACGTIEQACPGHDIIRCHRTITGPPRSALDTLELRHLRYFVAAAELEHLSRAAERQGVSASTLSHQIRQPEDALGLPVCGTG